VTRTIRFLADEDFDNDIVRGLLRRLPELDLVRVQDVMLGGERDEAILEWAASALRIVLTHDVSTMTAHAIARLDAGWPMSGLFAVSQAAPIGRVIDDLVLVAQCSAASDWDGQIYYLPFA
jgi:hypothetical protein